jgi:LysR family transcriptional regulator, cyn operon transcriptional activator
MQHGYRLFMNLRHLRAFVTIADTGGVARAAARLNVSQPALSRQIHALEAELGLPLFDRVGRGVQLTLQGEDLLRRSRGLLAEADAFGERARALKSGQTGTLRVGATPQVIESVLADFLTAYQRRHPGVQVHLVEEGGALLPSRLERGDVHVAHMPVGDARFHGRLAFPLHVLAVLPEGHRLGRRAALEVDALADEPLLLMGHGFASRGWFEAACQLAHVHPRCVLESAAPQALIALARTGYGVAVVPSAVRIAPQGVRVVPLTLRGESIGRWSMIAWEPRRFLPPFAEQFIDGIVAAVQRDYPGREFTRRAPVLPKPKMPRG